MAILLKNNQLKEMSRICREINEVGAGVVTVVELDDILRLLYEEELAGRDLQGLYEPFIHLTNKVIVSYKNFREEYTKKLQAVEVA